MRNNKKAGRIVPDIPESKLLLASADLANAITTLGLRRRVQVDKDTVYYGTDIGEVVASVALALDYLGFETESEGGGFGKPPTLVVTHPLSKPAPVVEPSPNSPAPTGGSSLTPDQVWDKLSPGRRGIAKDLAYAALEDATHYNPKTHNAAVAIAYKLWFLLWEGDK